MNRRYRKTIIAGNWKMNNTLSQTKAFAEELKPIMPKGKWCSVVLCVPRCEYYQCRPSVQGLPHRHWRGDLPL